MTRRHDDGAGPALPARETPEAKLARVLEDAVAVVPYDPCWPRRFEEERAHLTGVLPAGLIRRIEHFGSTAVPGLPAKPVIDMLVEVTSVELAGRVAPPVLEAEGYDYFWRPTEGDDVPPFYPWFIRRGPEGERTHHIHMVGPGFPHWERLLFRDYLIERPELAREYAALKRRLAGTHEHDRIAYTEGKRGFIKRVTAEAARHYGKGRHSVNR